MTDARLLQLISRSQVADSWKVLLKEPLVPGVSPGRVRADLHGGLNSCQHQFPHNPANQNVHKKGVHDTRDRDHLVRESLDIHRCIRSMLVDLVAP